MEKIVSGKRGVVMRALTIGLFGGRETAAPRWRSVGQAALISAILIGILPYHAQAQSTTAEFHDDYADVNSVRLHYASVGQGPLILFLHGYPSFWYQWKDQMLEMSRDHLAVGLDMRGYNLSSKPTGLDPYKMKTLVEDVRQFAEKVGGKSRKFTLVAHDWGANVAWVFAMYHPEMLEKLIIINGAHPYVSERELRENAAQRYASNYFFVFNGYLAPGEKPIDENDTREIATRRAHAGFVDAEVKKGHYSEEDRQRWIDAWSQPRFNDSGLELLPGQPPQSSLQRHPSGFDDYPFLVGDGGHRGS